jgi:flagellar biosynthesis component FlhA
LKLVTITRVLAELVEERVPLEPFSLIVEALVRVTSSPEGETASQSDLNAAVRQSLAHQNAHRLRQISVATAPNSADSPEGIGIYTLHPVVEDELAQTLRGDPPRVAASPDMLDELHQAVRQTCPPDAIVLTRPALRRPLWESLHVACPRVHVISPEEIPATLWVETKGQIELS